MNPGFLKHPVFACVVALLVIFAIGGCSATQDPATLGKMAAQIENEPHNMDEILSRNGHTRETFEASVRKLAEDPVKAETYTRSYEQNLS